AGGPQGRALHALPAGPPRRGSGSRGVRRPAERGLGRGGEPPARPEGAHGVPAARPHQDPGRPLVDLIPGSGPAGPRPTRTTTTSRMKMKRIRKVVLAYSGGLDTSVILKWLQDTYGCEVVTFTADI